MKRPFLLSFIVLFICTGTGGAAWLLPVDEDKSSETIATPSSSTQAKPVEKSGFAGLLEEEAEDSPSSVKYEVSLLNAKKQDPATIAVSWQNPSSIQGYVLKIYRFTESFDSENKLIEDRLISTLNPPANTFVDKPQSAGKYFYAVTVTYNNTEYKNLTPDVSYSTVGLSVTPVVEPPKPVLSPMPTGLVARLKGADAVVVSWEISKDTNVKYNIYRAVKPIQKSEDLVQMIKSTRSEFVDEALSPGEYYYAVTAVNQAGENRVVGLGTNSLVAAVVVSKPVEVVKAPESVVVPVSVEKKEPVVQAPVMPAVTVRTETVTVKPPVVIEPKVEVKQHKVLKDEDYFNKLLVNIKYDSFFEGRYQNALAKLKILVSEPSCPADVKTEAELFIGKSYYHLGRYVDAIKILVKIKKDYPEEADFWISRAADKL